MVLFELLTASPPGAEPWGTAGVMEAARRGMMKGFPWIDIAGLLASYRRHIHVCVYMCIYTGVYNKYMNIYICIYMYIYVYIYISIYIYIYTYIYVHIHTHACTLSPKVGIFMYLQPWVHHSQVHLCDSRSFDHGGILVDLASVLM